MDDREVELILSDPTKRVAGDLQWVVPEPGATWVKFSAEVANEDGRPLKVYGSYNRVNHKLTYCLQHPGCRGRLYSLEIGQAHRGPDGVLLEETHKHRWTEDEGDQHVYRPDDITAHPGEVEKAWQEFCQEARIEHAGDLGKVPAYQEPLPW